MHSYIIDQSLVLINPQISKYSSSVFQRGLKLADKIINNQNQGIELIDLSAEEIAQSYLKTGLSYFALGNHQEAMIDFNLALDIVPNLLEAYVYRCLSQFYLMRFQLAFEDYKKAYGINFRKTQEYFKPIIVDVNDEAIKPIFQVLLIVGDYYHTIENYKKAIEVYTNVIKFNPKASAYDKRSSAHLALKNYQEALEDFQKTIDLEIETNKLLEAGEYFQFLATSYSILNESVDIFPEFIELFQSNFKKVFYSTPT
jgi:tetratricopeptide (TPR) repeat protein